MKTTNQKEVAKFIGVSESFLCEVKQGLKGFSKKNAKKISDQTGIPFEMLMLADGKKIYNLLAFSFSQKGD